MARKALEANKAHRRQLCEGNLKKQKEMEEKCLLGELQKALDKEIEKQRSEDKLRIHEKEIRENKELRQKKREEKEIIEERENISKVLHADNSIEIPSPQKVVYSPSFLERKTSNPTHYSARTTEASLFWSLQSDSNIGSSESYKPALIATDSKPTSNCPEIEELKKKAPAPSQLSSLS